MKRENAMEAGREVRLDNEVPPKRVCMRLNSCISVVGDVKWVLELIRSEMT